jgi:hypothetical protein
MGYERKLWETGESYDDSVARSKHKNPFSKLNERRIKFLRRAFLLGGIVVAFVLFFLLATISVPFSPEGVGAGSKVVFSWSGFIFSLGVLLIVMGLYILLHGLANLSTISRLFKRNNSKPRIKKFGGR